MNDIIEWLVKVEDTACRIYEKAAMVFADDAVLSAFLTRLASDEKMHYEAVRKASAYFDRHLKGHGEDPFIISLDAEARDAIEGPLNECLMRLEEGGLTRGELLRYVAEIEFSEANCVFLYVINALEMSGGEFMPLVANIERHKDGIEMFLERQPGGEVVLKGIRQTPGIPEKKILVVDDRGANVNLLKDVLSSVGTVDTANNGSEALGLVRKRRYSAVVTDVDMPLMSGMEFYNKAVAALPDLRDRFIFFTASADEEKMTFFRKNNLRYLKKPSPIKEIRNTVKKIAGM